MRDAIDVEIASCDTNDPAVGDSIFRKVVWVRKQVEALSLIDDICPLCVGEGVIEVHETIEDSEYQNLWLETEQHEPNVDGWHAVVCLTCLGKGHLADN